ncbi:uncharacterized protein I206_103989 [Kwoniella pini CBS 10737]|uniref:Uncharacterized protein n=1 Tax=Kwoniella pini CBS 10737 TaxID=1296096 RepID=A0A1B9I2Y6_9TREE|nr:uncharacterized protein I206_04437 [Kwoniella pini CBS 10737]OCF49906.1 hypothetical protein I206_04437 [Kwoniella pini CBS 10737]
MKLTLIIPALLFTLGAVKAELKITQPTADHWWVAQSLGTLAWDGISPDQFSVFLSNSDTNVLTSLLALTSITYAYDTSKTINPGSITPSGGYTILLTNPLNSSDVYAKSETFEIKAVGSAYPAQGSPSGGASAAVATSAVGSVSGSAASSSPSASASGTNSGAGRKEVAGITMGFIALIGVAIASN